MRSLAEFAMRGRLPALFLAVAGAGNVLFCWISAAIIALVTLRKGAGEGLWLLLWALLPAGAVAVYFGNTEPLAMLLGTMVLAAVLRSTVSLPLTMLVSVAIALAVGVGHLWFGGAHLEQLAVWSNEVLVSLGEYYSQGREEPIVFPPLVPAQIAGGVGLGSAVTSALCLLLARYWQASLYNPGGFGAEFRALRYPVAVSTGLVVLGLAFSMLEDFSVWAVTFFVPLSFAGFALVHARVAARGQGKGWLTVFYLAWVFLPPVRLLVVMFAIADSWIDFRQRWGTPPRPPQDNERRDEQD